MIEASRSLLSTFKLDLPCHSPAAERRPEIKQSPRPNPTTPFLPSFPPTSPFPLSPPPLHSFLRLPYSHVRLTSTGPLQARPSKTQPSYPGPYRKLRSYGGPLARSQRSLYPHSSGHGAQGQPGRSSTSQCSPIHSVCPLGGPIYLTPRLACADSRPLPHELPRFLVGTGYHSSKYFTLQLSARGSLQPSTQQ